MKIIIQGVTIECVRGDITKQKGMDAVVNAANKRLAPGGGVAGAIHRVAGPGLWEECKKLGRCETGEARISKAYNLPNKYVIHTVGPVYSGSNRDPLLLRSSYLNSLKIADQNNIKSIVFPALSTGAFGYPIKPATEIAINTVIETIPSLKTVKHVRFVLYSQQDFEIYETILQQIIGKKIKREGGR